MNKRNIALIMLILVFMSMYLGFSQTRNKSIGRINFILGDKQDIKVHHPGFRNWLRARLYSPVYDGDRLKTLSESRCEIKMNQKGVIRIGENADFTLKPASPGRKSSSVLRKGRLWASLKGLFNRRRFQIRTPTAVCSVRGTIYRIDADSSTKVLVYDGSVDVGPLSFADDDSTKQQLQQQQPLLRKPTQIPGPSQVPGPFEVSLEDWVRIVAGQQIEVRADGKYHKSKIDNNVDADDEWVKWNKTRDKVE
jgi:hypothetical protein